MRSQLAPAAAGFPAPIAEVDGAAVDVAMIGVAWILESALRVRDPAAAPVWDVDVGPIGAGATPLVIVVRRRDAVRPRIAGAGRALGGRGRCNGHDADRQHRR